MEYLRSYLDQTGFAPSVALVAIFYALLRAARGKMWRVALLSLPGTIAHELTHLIVGFLFHAKPHGFSVWPRPGGNGWMLGSVSFRNIGLLNGAFVALAPLLLLPIAWLCLIHVLVPLWIGGQWGWWVLAGYLAATALFAAMPSLQDLKIGGRSLLLYAALSALLWWAYAHAFGPEERSPQVRRPELRPTAGQVRRLQDTPSRIPATPGRFSRSAG